MNTGIGIKRCDRRNSEFCMTIFPRPTAWLFSYLMILAVN